MMCSFLLLRTPSAIGYVHVQAEREKLVKGKSSRRGSCAFLDSLRNHWFCTTSSAWWSTFLRSRKGCCRKCRSS